MKVTPAMLVVRVLVVAFSGSLFAGYVLFSQRQAQSASVEALASHDSTVPLAEDVSHGIAKLPSSAPGSKPDSRSFMLSGSKTYAGATIVTEQLRQVSNAELSEVSRRTVIPGTKSATLRLLPGVPGVAVAPPEPARVTLSPVLPSTGAPGSESGELMELAGTSTSSAGAEVTRELRQVMNTLVPQPSPRELMLDIKSPIAAGMSGQLPRAGTGTAAAGSRSIGASEGNRLGDTSAIAVPMPAVLLISANDEMRLPSSFPDRDKSTPLSEDSVSLELAFSALSTPFSTTPNPIFPLFPGSKDVTSLDWSGTDGRARMDHSGTLAFGVPVEPRSFGQHAFIIDAALRSFGMAAPMMASSSKFSPVLVPWQGGRSLETNTTKSYYTGAHWDLPGAIRDLERRLKPVMKELLVKGQSPRRIMSGSKSAPVMTELPQIQSVIDLPGLTAPQEKP